MLTLVYVRFVILNLHEIALDEDGLLPRLAILYGKLGSTIVDLTVACKLDNCTSPKLVTVIDGPDGVELVYLVRTRSRQLAPEMKWHDVRNVRNSLVDLVMDWERP